MMEIDDLPVVIIGAGPVGLAAAAHLHERRMPFVVFEAGGDVGDSVRDWGHVQMFSPWRDVIDPVALRLLERTGWEAPDPGDHPTGGELVDVYLAPMAALPEIAVRLRTDRLVTSVTRSGMDKVRTAGRARSAFVVATDGPRGPERTLARAVIDASGTWTSPNPMGAAGVPALGERRAEARIDHGIPDALGRDRRRFAGRRIAVVGSGHSAQQVVRDLATLARQRSGTEITWLVRRTDAGAVFGGGEDDHLPRRGRLGIDARAAVDAGLVRLETGFRVVEVIEAGERVELRASDGRVVGPFDRMVAATGSRPDLRLLDELRIDVDPALESARALAPHIGPEVLGCGTDRPHAAAELGHPEPGLFVVGAKSYGRASSFLLATGYEQVRSVVAALAGDDGAASPHGRSLPRADVCSRAGGPAAAACCN